MNITVMPVGLYQTNCYMVYGEGEKCVLIDPGYMPAGEINYGLLQSLLPFDNQLTLCSIKGRDLLSKFIETDHYSYFIHYTLYGHSIRDNVDPDATYYVITDSFSAYYAPNKMTVIETYDEDVFARDLLADYMGEGGLA